MKPVSETVFPVNEVPGVVLVPDGVQGSLIPTARSAAVWVVRTHARVHTSGGSPVLPCPVSSCALLVGQDGRCMDLDGREWKGQV